MSDDTSATGGSLDLAREQAREVRALYEILEQRLNGQVWTLHELLLGLTNDVGTVGRLVLAHDGTWDIDGDVPGQLEHKLSEVIWWAMVVADRLDIDISAGFDATMDRIRDGLRSAVSGG